MAKPHSLTEHVFGLTNGTVEYCCETEIVTGIAIILCMCAIGAICAPFLNPEPSGD